MAGLGREWSGGLVPPYALSVGGRPDRRKGRGAAGCSASCGLGYHSAIPPFAPLSRSVPARGERRRRRALA